MAQQVFPKEIVVKWSGKEYIIDELSDRDTVLCLKNAIQKKTGVLPQRQKIIGLMYKSKPVTDELFLRDLNLKPKTKIMMVGSLEENISEVASGPADVPDVVDDFDVAEVEKSIQDRSEFLAKIEKRIRDYDLKLLNQPRPNKHLLVLDIDYTLFDHRSEAQSAAELMRPYLHEFLISAYNDYDIMIWSATSMKWIEAKMKELGVATHQEYKILGYMDSAAMTSIHSSDHGLLDVKPLGVIWGKLPQFTKQNTIMFDDISRNFLMNPQNGLKIRPFRKAHINRYKDRELLYLASYLKVIAKEADLSQLDHRKWERYLEKHSTKPDGS